MHASTQCARHMAWHGMVCWLGMLAGKVHSTVSQPLRWSNIISGDGFEASKRMQRAFPHRQGLAHELIWDGHLPQQHAQSGQGPAQPGKGHSVALKLVCGPRRRKQTTIVCACVRQQAAPTCQWHNRLLSRHARQDMPAMPLAAAAAKMQTDAMAHESTRQVRSCVHLATAMGSRKATHTQQLRVAAERVVPHRLWRS